MPLSQCIQHHTSPLSTVTHKLPNGVKTPFFEELEAGKIPILPKTAEEFQQMLELVMYNPWAYTFHHRFREALLDHQRPNYRYLEQSKTKKVVSCTCTVLGPTLSF